MWWKRCAPSAPSSTRTDEVLLREASRARSARAARPPGAREPPRPPRGRRSPTTDAGSITDRSLDCERVEPRREERLDRGRHVDLRQLLGEPPRPPPRARRRRSSTSIRRSCSAKSGLPSDAATTRSSTAASSEPPPSRPSIMRLRVARRRAARGRCASRASPVLQSGVSSRSSGRVGQRTSTGASHACDQVLDQGEHRRLGPVDVLHDEDTGRSAARWARSRRTAQNSSSTGNGSTDSAERGREARRHAVARRVGERGELRPPPPSRRRR